MASSEQKGKSLLCGIFAFWIAGDLLRYVAAFLCDDRPLWIAPIDRPIFMLVLLIPCYYGFRWSIYLAAFWYGLGHSPMRCLIVGLFYAENHSYLGLLLGLYFLSCFISCCVLMLSPDIRKYQRHIWQSQLGKRLSCLWKRLTSG
jgi:hypothetical protein